MVRKAIVMSVVVVLVLLALSVVWLAFADSSPLSSPVELQKNLPGEFGYSVYQLADGSLILNTANGTCTFLVKLDSSNQVLWTKPILIDPANTTLPRLRPTADGGFVLAGIMDNLFTVVKTDPDGNITWTKTYNSGAPINYFQSIIQTQDGGYAIAGFGELVDEGLGWIWFVKTDSTGNMEWNRTISGPLADCPSSVFQTSDGGYVLSDVSYAFMPNHAFYRLITLDSSGNVVGSTLYGGEGYYYQPECNFAIATRDGGYLMAGYLWQKNAWAVKTDAEGNMQWNQTYGLVHSSITSAVETPNGGYLLVAISNLTEVQLIMTDGKGNQVWEKTLPDVKLPVGLEASFNSLISAKDGGYIMIGSKNGQVWLAEFDVQQGGPIPLQLLPYVEAALAVAIIATVLVAAKTGKGRKNQKVGGRGPPMKQLGKIVFALIALSIILALSVGSMVQAFGIVGAISLGHSGGCYGLAYDSHLGEVFVANGDTDSVYVISDSTNAVVVEVPVGRVPYGAAYDSGMGEVFVANHGADSVSVISDLNNTVVATIKVGKAPSAVAYDSGRGEVFVANYNSSSVSVIADNNNTVVANITVGTQPCALAYDSSKNEVFVGHAGSNQVLVISDVTNAIVANITVENQPLSLAYDSGMGEIFVASYNSSSVSVISDSTNQIVATVDVGPSPNCVEYDPDNGRIFVTNYNSTSLSVVSDSNNTVIANVRLPKQPQGITFDFGKSELFVTYSESNKVSVIGDSAALPQKQTLPEFTVLVLILLATAVAFIAVNLVHLKSNRRAKPPRFP